MSSSKGSVAFHLPYQVVNPGSIASERRLFAQAIAHVVDGFVPAQSYLAMATLQESAWRRYRNERALEERTELLLQCSLNPVSLISKAFKNVQALQAAANLFLSNEALAVKTHVAMKNEQFAMTRIPNSDANRLLSGSGAQPSTASESTTPAKSLQPSAWDGLSLCKDAIACILDVMRNHVTRRKPKPAHPSIGDSVVARKSEFVMLARLLGQEHTPLFALLSLLDTDPVLTLAETATQLGCKERTLQRQLQSAGLGFMQVRMAGYLARSVRLIAQGEPLSQVAVLAGFFDYPHFARVFKRSTGLSPRDFERLAKHTHLEELGGAPPGS